jgi:Tol biopolymer transport system component
MVLVILASAEDTMTILPRPRPPRTDEPADVEALEALIEEARRRARRRRRGCAAAALVAAAAGLLGFYGFNHGGEATLAQDGGGPASGQATNVFAQVRGWIVYTDEFAKEELVGSCADNPGCGDEYGIWAVDPTRPAGLASDRVQLRETVAVPLDWSDDGTKLLIEEPYPKVSPSYQTGPNTEQRRWRLVVLNADGTETVLRTHTLFPNANASLSPDGSQVVYASWSEESGGAGIYVIDTDGGRPHLLQKGGRRQWYSDGWARTSLEDPAFSPDGTKIAYIDGMHDGGNGVRVMDADGSHVRVLLDSDGELSDGISIPGCEGALAWSPDGSRLAFCGPGGIWVIGVDGSGLRKVIPNGERPSWSPDGSRIAYQVRGPISLGPLRIADADDGGNVQKFTWGNSGPWNPPRTD